MPFQQMLEVPTTGGAPIDKSVGKCDVALLLYDGHSSTSFSYIYPIYQHIQHQFPSLPCVIVQTKTDLPAVNQESKPSPANFLSKNKHVVHATVSTKSGRPSKLFEDIVAIAVGQRGKSGHVASWKRKLGLGITITVVGVGLVLAGRLLWKAWRK